MSIPGFEAPGAGAGAVVQITLGQVFNEVRQVHDLLNALTGKLEPMRDQLVDHEKRLRAVDPLPSQVTDLEEDLASLGRKVDGLRMRAAMVVGGATVLGAGVGSVVTVLITHR